MSAPPAAPTGERHRIEAIDAFRGVALGAIFLLNLAPFTGFAFMTMDDIRRSATASVDLPMAGLIVWLGYGKFYSLFSLLFGIGFTLQLAAAEARGDRTLSLFRRRLAVLLAIGAVHLYVWEGDILVLYALVGFLLVPLRHLSNRSLLRSAAALVLAPVGVQLLITVSDGRLDPGAPLVRAARYVLIATGFSPDALPFPTLRDAGWAEFLRFQASGAFFRYADLLTTGRPFKVLAMFLVGVAVGRSGLLLDVEPWLPTLRRVRRWGFAVGLPGALAHAALFVSGSPANSWMKVLESLAYAIGVAPLALAYASTLVLLWQSPRWRARIGVLAPAGRMALTNYLMQTAIAIALFYGVGLGLMGRVGPALWPVVMIATIGTQAVVSRWWLARFAFGPMEWIWRQGTYGRRLPLRN